MAKKNFFNMNSILIVLLALNAIFGIYVAFIKPDAYSLETLKVWGKSNMKMAMELYKSDMYKEQQKSTLEQILGSMDQTAPTTQEATTEDTPALTLEGDMLANLTKGEYILGNEDARITIVEYSEFICPYCKRHYNDQTLENLVKKYPDDVNMIFKQFPIAQLHPTAPLGAQGAVCAWKLGGTDTFYEYVKEAFAANVNDFTEDSVVALAKKVWLSTSKFTDCVTSEDTIAEVNASIQEAQSFGIDGTPGNLIVDNENGTYVVVAGAYPLEAFEAEIEKILK